MKTGCINICHRDKTHDTRNRQGSTMAVVDDSGAAVQRTGYYASGTPFVLPVDSSDGSVAPLDSITDRLHIGNRWLGLSGLAMYDNTARVHDPVIPHMLTCDKYASKFPNFSPFSHCAGNPANILDPSGNRIVDFYSGCEWKEVNNEWGFYDSNNLPHDGHYEFTTQLSNALKTLMIHETGKMLVEEIANSSEAINIAFSVKTHFLKNENEKSISWNNTDGASAVPTTEGDIVNPLMNLAHELAHAYSEIKGMEFGFWYMNGTDEVRTSEIFATHIENKIRAEQSLPLRTYYSVEEGIYKGRIINKKNGTSLFYDSKEKTNYKKLKKEQIPFKYGAK